MLEYMFRLASMLRSREEGQTAVEYALVLLLIALVLVVALASGLGGLLSDVIVEITGSI